MFAVGDAVCYQVCVRGSDRFVDIPIIAGSDPPTVKLFGVHSTKVGKLPGNRVEAHHLG